MMSELTSYAARLRALISDPQAETRIRFAELALELFGLQFEANSAYRKICNARRATPLTVSDWRQIPTVPTAAFKELELSCLPTAERTQEFHSSGTTEQRPSRHFHNAESLATYEASLWAWFARMFRPEANWRLMMLTPAPADAPRSSLVHMCDTVRRKLGGGEKGFGAAAGGGAWDLDLEFLVAQLLADANKPWLILGTAFSFVHLLDHLAEAGLRFKLPRGSRVMETGGYKGRSREIPKAELHQMITQRLGIPKEDIVCEYGMSELSSQAYDTPPGGRVFRFPPWARVQMVNPETGREAAEGATGLIRVFDLANVFSVMAVQTEDLGIRRGDGFELIGRAARAEPRGCSLMAV